VFIKIAYSKMSYYLIGRINLSQYYTEQRTKEGQLDWAHIALEVPSKTYH
jgi:hypothetical protein